MAICLDNFKCINLFEYVKRYVLLEVTEHTKMFVKMFCFMLHSICRKQKQKKNKQKKTLYVFV